MLDIKGFHVLPKAETALWMHDKTKGNTMCTEFQPLYTLCPLNEQLMYLNSKVLLLSLRIIQDILYGIFRIYNPTSI